MAEHMKLRNIRHTFVVATEDRNRRMVPETFHVVHRLLAYALYERIECGVYSTCELEVLPHEDTEL